VEPVAARHGDGGPLTVAHELILPSRGGSTSIPAAERSAQVAARIPRVSWRHAQLYVARGSSADHARPRALAEDRDLASRLREVTRSSAAPVRRGARRSGVVEDCRIGRVAMSGQEP
jgi:hypothetical protein